MVYVYLHNCIICVSVHKEDLCQNDLNVFSGKTVILCDFYMVKRVNSVNCISVIFNK